MILAYPKLSSSFILISSRQLSHHRYQYIGTSLLFITRSYYNTSLSLDCLANKIRKPLHLSLSAILLNFLLLSDSFPSPSFLVQDYCNVSFSFRLLSLDFPVHH